MTTFVIDDKSYPVPLDGSATHLATTVGRMNDLSAQFLADLAFVFDYRPLADIFVENYNSFLAADFLGGLDLFDQEPFLEIPFSAVKVHLILRQQPFFFEVLPDLAACGTVRVAL